jgi:hypothetical protein
MGIRISRLSFQDRHLRGVGDNDSGQSNGVTQTVDIAEKLAQIAGDDNPGFENPE